MGENYCICSPFDDSMIENMLVCGDVRSVLYDLLLRMAQNDSLTLPDGTSIPNNEKYWLRLAVRYRPNKNGNLKRTDEVFKNESRKCKG